MSLGVPISQHQHTVMLLAACCIVGLAEGGWKAEEDLQVEVLGLVGALRADVFIVRSQ